MTTKNGRVLLERLRVNPSTQCSAPSSHRFLKGEAFEARPVITNAGASIEIRVAPRTASRLAAVVMLETERLAEDLRLDYPSVRVLPDGSIAALYPLLTTTSVVLGCTRDGWASRFCFRDPGLALQRFNEVQSEDDWLEGSIAQRGRAQLRPESMRKSP